MNEWETADSSYITACNDFDTTAPLNPVHIIHSGTQPPAPSPEERIASALERIATALERLSGIFGVQ